MKHTVLAAALLLLATSPGWAAPKIATQPLSAMLAAATDKAEVRIRGKVAEDLGKNKYLVQDGKHQIEVKGGPHWYHTLPLQTGQTYTYDGVLRIKDKDGEKRTELKLVRVWRADGAALVVRANGKAEPWKEVDNASAGAPKVLVWQIPTQQGAKP